MKEKKPSKKESKPSLMDAVKDVLAFINDVPRDPDYDLATKLLETGKMDIEATKILYKNELFASSTFHLQQAVEKVVKCYGVIFFRYTKKQLIDDVSHKTPMAFLKALEIPGIGGVVTLIKLIHPEIKTDTSEAEKIIEGGGIELLKTSTDEINLILDNNDKIEKALKNEDLKRKIDFAIKLLNVITPKVKKGEKSTEDIFNLDLVASFIAFWLTGSITFPHAITSRYPGLALDPSEYKRGLGIVDTTPRIITLCEKAVENIENYMKRMKQVSIGR